MIAALGCCRGDLVSGPPGRPEKQNEKSNPTAAEVSMNLELSASGQAEKRMNAELSVLGPACGTNDRMPAPSKAGPDAVTAREDANGLQNEKTNPSMSEVFVNVELSATFRAEMPGNIERSAPGPASGTNDRMPAPSMAGPDAMTAGEDVDGPQNEKTNPSVAEAFVNVELSETDRVELPINVECSRSEPTCGTNDRIARAAAAQPAPRKLVPLPDHLPLLPSEAYGTLNPPGNAPRPAPWPTQPTRRTNPLEDSVWSGVDPDLELTKALDRPAYVYRPGQWRPPSEAEEDFATRGHRALTRQPNRSVFHPPRSRWRP